MNFDNSYFLIPARKDSKGLPFKNRRLFDFTAKTIPPSLCHKVFVSTNDDFVKERAKAFNFQITERPEGIARDESSLKSVLKHFVEEEGLPDNAHIILLFLTYPQRTWEDIAAIYSYFLSRPQRSLICCEEVKEHPFLCFYDKGDEGAELVVEHKFYRRQDYPKCVRQSMFVGCYEVNVVNDLHDLLFEKETILYKLETHKIDVDYEEDYLQWKK